MQISQLIQSLEVLNISDKDKWLEMCSKVLKLLMSSDEEFKQEILENPHDGLIARAIIEDKTGKIFEAIMSDSDLASKIVVSNPRIGLMLQMVINSNPDLVSPILRNEELMKAVHDSDNPMAIRDILYCSKNKADADLVFSKPEIYGAYHEDLELVIYNTIAENYRDSIPESLFKLSLFKVQNLPVEEQKKLPVDLQEKLRNFRPGK